VRTVFGQGSMGELTSQVAQADKHMNASPGQQDDRPSPATAEIQQGYPYCSSLEARQS
jgi:hypothetical protein